MQEQNFEKQVQLKMEELNLTPSAPVWQKVEKEIRKKNDRRRLILWLFLFLLVGGGTTTWLVMDKPAKENIATAPVKKQDNNAATSITESNQTNQPSAPTETITDDPGSTLNINEPFTPNNEVNTNTSSDNITDINKTKGEDRKNINRNIPVNRTQKNIEAVSTIDKNDQVVSKPQEELPKPLKEESKPVETETEPVVETAKPANEPKPTEKQVIPVEPVKADTVTTKEEKKKEAEVIVKKDESESSKWKLGVTAGVGLSNVYNKIFSQAVVQDYASPSTGSGAFAPPPPAKLRSGMYYAAGLSLSKELNERWTLITGLQYAMFSTRNSVGQELRRDTVLYQNNETLSLDNYYRNSTFSTTRSDYTNRYHMIELPVGIAYKPFGRIPLSIGAGISLTQLLFTNALVYNRSAGIYYEDKEVINKTQLHAQANLSYRLWNKKKFSLSAGPFIQTGITPVVKDDKDRLFAAGLKTHISF